jgi:hypothetical protein
MSEEAMIMRETNAWIIVLTLVLALGLICASANGIIGISLPVAVLLGLGINAFLLLWENRQKLVDILGTRR